MLVCALYANYYYELLYEAFTMIYFGENLPMHFHSVRHFHFQNRNCYFECDRFHFMFYFLCCCCSCCPHWYILHIHLVWSPFSNLSSFLLNTLNKWYAKHQTDKMCGAIICGFFSTISFSNFILSNRCWTFYVHLSISVLCTPFTCQCGQYHCNTSSVFDFFSFLHTYKSAWWVTAITKIELPLWVNVLLASIEWFNTIHCLPLVFGICLSDRFIFPNIFILF